MITLKKVRTVSGKIEDKILTSTSDRVIDCKGMLTLLPALTDSQVHFRTPGETYKEDWITGARAAIQGGITQVFDMPDTNPTTTTKDALIKKRALIDGQLKEAKIPLRYHLFVGASTDKVDTLNLALKDAIAIQVSMDSSKGDLLIKSDAVLRRIFQIAAQEKKIIAVRAEDEARIQERTIMYSEESDPEVHSRIRDRKAALLALEKAISLASEYKTELLIQHVSTKEEIDLIKKAKKAHNLIFVEISPHHLFLNESFYKTLKNKAKVNPPLRKKEDQEALWEAINEGVIDMISSGHAPHTLLEKTLPYKDAPAGIPLIELMLPLLLTAYHEKKITLAKIIELTHSNVQQIFNLPLHHDVVLVDLEEVREVNDASLKTKCGWSPYRGLKLKGWPKYTICQGEVFAL
jgi:dihydroorotase